MTVNEQSNKLTVCLLRPCTRNCTNETANNNDGRVGEPDTAARGRQQASSSRRSYALPLKMSWRDDYSWTVSIETASHCQRDHYGFLLSQRTETIMKLVDKPTTPAWISSRRQTSAKEPFFTILVLSTTPVARPSSTLLLGESSSDRYVGRPLGIEWGPDPRIQPLQHAASNMQYAACNMQQQPCSR